MRIVDLDTSRGDNCPNGWTTPNDPTYPSLDVCQSQDTGGAGCFPTTFSAYNVRFVAKQEATKEPHQMHLPYSAALRISMVHMLMGCP